MDHDLKIPADKRHEFARPLGKLVSGSRKETIAEIADYFKKQVQLGEVFDFYLVGDIVTLDFLDHPFLKSYVKLCVIDEKTQRKQIEIEFKQEFPQIFELKCPAGTIPRTCWQVLKEITKSPQKTVLRITEGEEDLLVLPLIMNLPLNDSITHYVFYGQPPITDAKLEIPEGIVMVKVTEEIQKKVQKYINIMEKF